MHRLLLAALLVGPGVSGCFGRDEPVEADATPAWLPGTWFQYRYTDDDGTFVAQFVVAPGATFRARHLDHGFVPRPHLDGPFMHLDEDLTPIGPRWADLLPFPVRPGIPYRAVVDGLNVTLQADPMHVETSVGRRGVFRVSVVDGPPVIELDYAPSLGAYTWIAWNDEAGASIETWRLVGAGGAYPYGGPSTWALGDWWRFDASSWGLRDEVTLVNTADTVEVFEVATVPVRIAEPVDSDHLLLSTPFVKVDPRTMHPRSGAYSSLISKTYDFPLRHGATWSSNAHDVPFGARVLYVPEVQFAGGSAYGFHIEARTQASTTIAVYDYVPAVKWFTRFMLKDAKTNETVFDWRLLGFGSQYVGPLERAVRQELRADTVSDRRADVAFRVEDADVDLVDLTVRFITTADADPPAATLFGPDGTERLELRAGACGQPACFVPDQGHVSSEPGGWRLVIDSPAGTTVEYSVRTIDLQTVELDFRRS